MAPRLALRPRAGRERGEVLPPHAPGPRTRPATGTCSKLVTDAHLEGFYHRPRIDKELLAEHAEGLIGLSGCLASETARLLLAGQDQRAARGGGRLPRHLRAGQLLPRAAGPRARRAATAEPRWQFELGARSSASRSWPRTTSTTPSARTRSPTTCCCASSSRRCRATPNAAEVRHRGVLPEGARGDAGAVLRSGPRRATRRCAIAERVRPRRSEFGDAATCRGSSRRPG